MKQILKTHYGKGPARTLMMGGSNGGHHTEWMVESYPDLYDGGIAGYGFNSQVSQWGSIATVLRNYDVIVARIDDIVAKRNRIQQSDWGSDRCIGEMDRLSREPRNEGRARA